MLLLRSVVAPWGASRHLGSTAPRAPLGTRTLNLAYARRTRQPRRPERIALRLTGRDVHHRCRGAACGILIKRPARDGNIRTAIPGMKQRAVDHAAGDGHSRIVRHLYGLVPDIGIPNIERAAGRKRGEHREMQHRMFDAHFRLSLIHI